MAKPGVLRDERIVGSSVVHLAGMFILLFVFWLILSGRTDAKFIIYGLLTSMAAAWITYPLLLVRGRSGAKKYFVFGVWPHKLLRYFAWLMWQLVLANLDVMLATASERLDIDPKVVRFRFRTDNPMAEVALANSITLTPGTVTINVTDEGIFEIHALTVGAAAGVLDGGMQKKVAELFGETYEFSVVEGAAE